MQHIGAHDEGTRFVNRETVSCDEVSELFHDADASSVDGTGGVDSVYGTRTFVGDISSYGYRSKSNWHKRIAIQVYVGRTPVTGVRTARQPAVTCDVTS